MNLASLGLMLLTAATGENHPPEFNEFYDTYTCHVGATCEFSFTARDDDGDPLTVTTSTLPEGMVLRPTSAESAIPVGPRGAARPTVRSYTLSLKAKPDQTGEYPITVVASDGQTSATREVTVEIEEEWEVYALPGLQYVTYQPRATLDTGGYHGVSVEFLGGAWAHRNNKHGPSHGRIYIDLDLLVPLSGHGGNLYAYTAGMDLTLERNPGRRFLLPYFGAEVGGVHSAQLGDYFIAAPYGGVHVWADRNLWVNLSGGYIFPGRALDQLSGAWAKAGFDLSFW